MFELTGKTALITGASGAIGGGIARVLHAQGATVALSGTKRDALDSLAADLGGHLGIGLRLKKETARQPRSGSCGGELAAGAPWALRNRAVCRPRSREVVEFLHLRTRGSAHLSYG